MSVPQYCRSRQGRVFRIHRLSERLDGERMRYTLRAVPVRLDQQTQTVEASTELGADLVRDKIRHRQLIPSPEATFEQLWQQLRLDLDA